MPIITKISTQKRKGRYNIFIDNEYAFSVSERTLAEKRLLKGTELSTDAKRQSEEKVTFSFRKKAKAAPGAAFFMPDV